VARTKRTNGKANGKAPRKRIRFATFVIPPPRWNTREEALAYLRGEFSGWLDALTDLREFEAYAPPEIPCDLSTIALALAEYLVDGHPTESEDAGADKEACDGLVRAIGELAVNSKAGVNAEGLGHELSEETLPLLARALAFHLDAACLCDAGVQRGNAADGQEAA
jgi:hypothetical protein